MKRNHLFKFLTALLSAKLTFLKLKVRIGFQRADFVTLFVLSCMRRVFDQVLEVPRVDTDFAIVQFVAEAEK